MKIIHLIRHAKSCWDNPILADKLRPLNKRGHKDCQIMAKQIVEAGCNFKSVFVSNATRAKLTIELIQENLPNLKFDWSIARPLYTFDETQLLNWCQALSEELSEVVIVGHNPALTELINHLSRADLLNLPTCGYAKLHCSITTWQELHTNCAQLKMLLTPKMFR
ncbi:SixA phosphatase family protein [Aliikangiella maris]|uniref:Histidine phosphatase family protein n=2 Tax=Aliikangiella maris TaxID=3162458 RepID=A0ABV2BUS8_9GAMM